MRIRRRNNPEDEKVTLQMTPMIDIVFQLLIFFIMSFKMATQEGDFNVKMPVSSSQGANVDPTSLPMTLRLTADEQGNLTGIRLNEAGFERFSDLHNRIISMVGGNQPSGLSESAELEIDADYQLRYEYVIEAISAVTGYRTADHQIVKLIEKIRFTPPKK